MRSTAIAATACAVMCALGLTTGSAAATGPLPVYQNTHYSFAERAADLVSRMSLAEKVDQLSTIPAPAIPRLGVQQYIYSNEGQHGVGRLGASTNPPAGQVNATSFPTNFASSMAWDPDLEYQETTAVSDEIRGFLDKSLWGVSPNNIGPDVNGYGSLTYWAPTVNMDRDPRWGRTDEGFGEDPYLVGQIGDAFIDGYQGNSPNGKSLNGYLKVAATAKHFALNDVELNRTGITSDAGDADIRDYYTAQFRELIENAHVSGLMTSYNAINGTPAVADTYTANELAQRTYGFDGYMTSDCGAVSTTYRTPPNGHNWAPPGWTTDGKDVGATWTNTATGQQVSGAAGGQAYSLRAGTTVNCPGDEKENTLPNIQEAIDAGVLSEGVLDEDLVHLFTVRMQTGEFDPVGSVPYTKITKDTVQSPAHQQLAQKVADNSLVLLKNDHNVLPVNPAKVKKVMVLGDLANKVTLGDYSGQPTTQVGAVGGVKAAMPDAQVIFDSAGTSTTSTGPATLSTQTRADIASADLVVVFVGADSAVADESHDRNTLALPGNYHSLITQVAALGNPNTALVVQAGGPVVLDDVQGSVPAILFSGPNGEAQGAALADVLTGRQNPSGHLNFTWYKDDSQLPDMSNYGLAPGATGGLGRTYQYFTGTPSYPFGYGLSYSNYRYSQPRIDRSTVNADGTVNISFTVTNTGKTAGATVAQLYAAQQFTVPNVELPIKRLAGFKKTDVLRAGASQQITIPVQISDLSLWDGARQRVYDGTYQFQVAANSHDVTGSVSAKVTGAITPKTAHVTVQPAQVEFRAGETLDLTGKNKWIADDTGQQHATADNIVEAVNNDQSFVDLTKAKVAYASSNMAVATVDSKGLVRAAGDGVATIKVTVNGVSGTAVIVVGHSVALTAPPVVAAGGSATATTTFTNGGTAAIRDVKLSITIPSGWKATATSPAAFSSVAGGQTVKTTWQITAPATATPGTYPVGATVSSSAGARTDTGQTSVPYSSLAAAYNNVGISDDGDTAAGNLDGGGLSYSAQTLAGAGLAAGGTVRHDGLTFTWPNPGTPDNVLTGGQSVLLSGSGSKLGFIGTGDSGAVSGTGTIVYTDGTTQQYTLGFDDWWSGSTSIPGEEVVATLPYLNNSGGQQAPNVHMYYASAPLTAGKTVSVVTLPNVNSVATPGQPKLHVFAVAAG